MIRDVPDELLHPDGECSCGGEGMCDWCNRHCVYCGGDNCHLEECQRPLVAAVDLGGDDQASVVLVARDEQGEPVAEPVWPLSPLGAPPPGYVEMLRTQLAQLYGVAGEDGLGAAGARIMRTRPEVDEVMAAHRSYLAERLDSVQGAPQVGDPVPADPPLPWWQRAWEHVTDWQLAISHHFSLRYSNPRHMRTGVPVHEQRYETKWLGLFRIIPEGSEWPRWYGACWRDMRAMRAVCAPIPLHLVAGAIYAGWWRMKRGFLDMASEGARFREADLQRQVDNFEEAERSFQETRVARCLICGQGPEAGPHYLVNVGIYVEHQNRDLYHAYTPGFPWDSLEVGWDDPKVKPLNEKGAKRCE